MRLRTMSLVLGLALTAAISPVAKAQPAATAERLVGRPVLSAEGKVLGVIERTLANADGVVRQVLVRTRKGNNSSLRPLPSGSLTPTAAGMGCVLSEAEFMAIPPVSDE